MHGAQDTLGSFVDVFTLAFSRACCELRSITLGGPGTWMICGPRIGVPIMALIGTRAHVMLCSHLPAPYGISENLTPYVCVLAVKKHDGLGPYSDIEST